MGSHQPFLHFTVADSDTRHARFLSSLNDVEARVVSIHARPATRRFGWVANDLLAVVGISDEVTGVGRNAQEDIAAVPIWFAAHRIEHVIVSGVEVLPAAIVAELIELAIHTRVRLWLVADHEISDPTLQILEQWPNVALTQSEFDRHWQKHLSQRPTGGELAGVDDVWPEQILSSDFPVFLAEAKQFLPSEEAEVVETRFRQVHDRAAAALTDKADGLTEEEATALLRSFVGCCTRRSELVTTVRAFQVAAFKAGWFIQVDLARLIAAGSHDVAAVAADPDNWRRLRAYRQPFRGATCAFTAMGIDADTQRQLTVGDVDADGATVTVGGEGVPAPAGAEPFLRAARLQRLADGAGSRELLFVRNGKTIGYRALLDAVSDAAAECGVLLSRGLLTRQKIDERHWRQRHGISVQSLVPPKEKAA